MRFACVPLGHELTSFVLALLQVGGHPPAVSEEVIEQIRRLDGDYEFVTYLSLSCQNCPEVVQALNLMSVVNPRIKHVAVDGALFKDEVEARGVLAVPSVFLNGEHFEQGRMTLEQILSKLDSGAAQRAAQEIGNKEPFDVLVVGAGPAGVSSAIYAARKSVRTGVAAGRIGGQVLDTMAIENFISVPYTEGPKFAAALEQHASDYEIDIMDSQQAVRLEPATQPGDLHTLVLENDATLKGRTVILATGARWRPIGVPGEQEYRNKGVTYCPHCDGPLFRGKPVAVIGGGNSGVEAAIDLAGIVSHVTLLELGDTLRADEVLQRKLRSLTNVDIVLNAKTTEVLGDGTSVTGLTYTDTETGESRRLDVQGVFVQIGLLPNTEWLEGVVELTKQGDRRRRAGRDLRAGSVRRGRLHDRALQADRDGDGIRCDRRLERVRLPGPHLGSDRRLKNVMREKPGSPRHGEPGFLHGRTYSGGVTGRRRCPRSVTPVRGHRGTHYVRRART